MEDMSCRVDGAELESAQYLARVGYYSKTTCSDGCCSESWWEGSLYKLNNGTLGERLASVGEDVARRGSICVEALLISAQDSGHEATMDNTIVTSDDEDYYY